MIDILTQSQTFATWVRDIRRELHRYPEVGTALPRTRALVLRELQPLGLTVRPDVGGGIVADLETDRPGPRIALRADMDALTMREETGLDFASQIPDQAHMCGHDAHTAMLLGAARLATMHRQSLPGPVRFLFQPNEENQPGGALPMVESGCLDSVNKIFGLHVWPGHPVGWVGTRPDALMARPDVFSITLTGQGGHASAPHLCLDPVPAACRLVCDLQTIVSRRVPPLEPAVVSVTTVRAGTAYNIIPDSVFLQGTVRSLSDRVGALIQDEMARLAKGLTAATGIRAEARYEQGYPVVVNDRSLANEVVRTAQRLGADADGNVAPVMAGEDFSHYLSRVPGCFFFLGCGNHGDQGLHNACFTLDEACLPWGVAMLTALALNDQPLQHPTY